MSCGHRPLLSAVRFTRQTLVPRLSAVTPGARALATRKNGARSCFSDLGAIKSAPLSFARSNACQHFPLLQSISGCSVTLPPRAPGTLPALLSHFIKYCEAIRLLPLPASAKHIKGWSAPRSRCPRFYRTLLSIAGNNACQHFPPLRSISGCSVTLLLIL